MHVYVCMKTDNKKVLNKKVTLLMYAPFDAGLPTQGGVTGKPS